MSSLMGESNQTRASDRKILSLPLFLLLLWTISTVYLNILSKLTHLLFAYDLFLFVEDVNDSI